MGEKRKNKRENYRQCQLPELPVFWPWKPTAAFNEVFLAQSVCPSGTVLKQAEVA